ncbi:hypothetical protein BC829DRAFT_388703 [Chytridium lagenaria]|nr:hypothetical protein BC829DRAFT_388703 [Chytridium lagenaria]
MMMGLLFSDKTKIIVGTDITNESFQNKLMDALSSIKFPFVIAVIDVLTGYIIATTVPTLSLVNPAGTIKRYNETTVPYFEDFSLMLSSTYGGNITNLWRAAAEATGTLPFRSSLMSYSGTVKDLHRDQNMTHPWMIVSYVNEDAVNQAYLSADKWTQSTIFLVMLVLLIVGSMFFIAFTLGLQRVVNHLKMVRDLRFKDLESPRKSLGKASVVRELDVLQNAFIEMLECLMDHKRKRSISHQEDRRLMSRSMPEVSVGLAGHGFTLGSNYFSSGGMNTNFIQTGPAPPVPEIPSSYLRSRKEN